MKLIELSGIESGLEIQIEADTPPNQVIEVGRIAGILNLDEKDLELFIDRNFRNSKKWRSGRFYVEILLRDAPMIIHQYILENISRFPLSFKVSNDSNSFEVRRLISPYSVFRIRGCQ